MPTQPQQRSGSGSDTICWPPAPNHEIFVPAIFVEFNMLNKQHKSRPLGMVAEDCFGSAHVDDAEGPIEVIRDLTNFYRLQNLVSNKLASRTLSWDQRHSYQLLFDWWAGAFQDPAIPLQYLVTFYHQSEILKKEELTENPRRITLASLGLPLTSSGLSPRTS